MASVPSAASSETGCGTLSLTAVAAPVFITGQLTRNDIDTAVSRSRTITLNKKHFAASLVVITYFASACSGDETSSPMGSSGGGSGPSNTSGSSAAGSSGTAGAGPSTAGTTSGGGGAGGAAGSANAGASSGTAGGGSGGTQSMAGGANGGAGMSGGGMSGGGMSGSAGAGGGGNTAATPSAGCSKGTARPTNGELTVSGKYYVNFPDTYDGKTPFPLIIGFHGCGDSNYGTNITSTEYIRKPKAEFGKDHVLAAPLGTQPTCWSNYANDTARVKEMYENLMSNYCIDTSRIFGTGHSSGAQYIQKIMGNAADTKYFNFKAVVPVAASPGNVATPIPVMYVQGQRDAERGNGDGHEVVENYRSGNKCMSTSKPWTGAMSCKTNQAGSNVMVDPGCIIYDGCQKPTIWCSHNDPSYSNTMHDTPCFVWQAMRAFFEAQ
jgi:polyhydroxybutyrate depolymerase